MRVTLNADISMFLSLLSSQLSGTMVKSHEVLKTVSNYQDGDATEAKC